MCKYICKTQQAEESCITLLPSWKWWDQINRPEPNFVANKIYNFSKQMRHTDINPYQRDGGGAQSSSPLESAFLIL